MAKLFFCLVLILLVNYTNQEKKVEKSAVTRFGEFNMYFVYTRDNPREPQRIQATVASINTFRNFRTKTVIIIHDHEGSGTTTLNPTVKDAFLTSEDVSVIVVDWSVIASQSYANVVGAVPSIGQGLGDLIRMLVQQNRINLTRLHIVGFGVGAHIAAYAARATNGVVARITALDPSGNQWGSNSDRLRLSDAAYVEVIHTDGEDGQNSSSIGIGEAIGHVDFFPNGGTRQNGCGTDHECNHKRAWELYAASLTHDNLVGNQCDSETTPAVNNCHGYTLPLGNNEMVKYGSGVFFLETGRTYPFAVERNCLLPCIVG